MDDNKNHPEHTPASSSSSSKKPTIEPLNIKEEAQRAVAAVRKHKYDKAMKLITVSCQKHKSSAYLHHIQAGIAETCSSIDPTKEDTFLRFAIKASETSVKLAPKSIEFALFLAYLVYLHADDANAYDEAIKKCYQGLEIENPSDPAEDRLLSDDEVSIKDPNERILDTKAKLEKLIGDCMQEKVILWWKLLSTGEKQSFLQVSVLDVKSHFSSLDNNLAEVISEALLYFQENEKWEFWECCCCDEKFSDSYKHLEHVWRTHFKGLSDEHSLGSSLIVNCDWINDWIKMITEGKWKPVDASTVRDRLEEHWKWMSSESKLMDSRNESFESIICDPKSLDRGPFFSQSCPESSNSERAERLECIQITLQGLLFKKALLAVHVTKVTKYAMNELHSLIHGSLEEIGLDQTHLCICLLGAPQLERIYKFLLEINDSCNKNFQAKTNIYKTSDTSSLRFESDVRMNLKGDLLSLFFNEASSRSGRTDLYTIPEESEDNDYSETSAVDIDCKGWGLPSDVTLMTWVSSCLSSEESLLKWTSLTEGRKHHWKEGLRQFETFLRKREVVEFEKGKDISEDVQSVDTSKQETLASVATDSSGPEIGKDGDSRRLKFLADTCKEADKQEKNDNNDLEFNQNDAWLVKVSGYMHQWALQINSFAAADYRAILFSLLKAYIKAQMSEIVGNDAKEKCEAPARKVGLAASKSPREDVDQVGPKLSQLGGTEKSEVAKETVLASSSSDTETVRKHNSRDGELDADMEKAMRQSILEEEIRQSKVTKNNFEKMESEGCVSDATEKSEATGEGELVDPKVGECEAETLRQCNSEGGEQPEAAEEGEQSEAAREAEQVDPTVEECDTEALRQLRSEEIEHQSDL